MVPNGHESTYVFFRCLIHLGLFRARIGFVRDIHAFLYNWDYDVKRDKNKKGKRGNRSLPKNPRKTRARK